MKFDHSPLYASTWSCHGDGHASGRPARRARAAASAPRGRHRRCRAPSDSCDRSPAGRCRRGSASWAGCCTCSRAATTSCGCPRTGNRAPGSHPRSGPPPGPGTHPSSPRSRDAAGAGQTGPLPMLCRRERYMLGERRELSAASEQTTPPPARISGRLAPSRSSSAFATASGEPGVRQLSCNERSAGSGTSTSAFVTHRSYGTSRWTGPGRPSRASLNAFGRNLEIRDRVRLEAAFRDHPRDARVVGLEGERTSCRAPESHWWSTWPGGDRDHRRSM